MGEQVADFMLHRLSEWGVRRIYGYPGDGINGLMGALGRAEERFEFIQVRHEETAAFMACAHAKFTGRTGVCLATSGPGAIHLLNGLYDARMDHQPVVAIVGQAKRMSLGGDFQQEVDLPTLFKDVASHYVQTITTPAQARHVIDRAFRIAMAERTVTCIIVPNDVQELPSMISPPRMHGAILTGVGYTAPRVVPHSVDLQRAADVLNAGKRVAMLVGAGAFGASAEVIKAAEVLQAGVAKALLGKAVLPDHLPFVTGAIGLLGTKPSYDMMMDCDTLFMIGSSFPYSEFLPPEGKARGVQIDIDPRKLSLRYPMEVSLQGDARATLEALLPLLKPRKDRASLNWRRNIEKDVAHWWSVLEARAREAADPINPQRVFWDLSPRLPDNCIITADSGSVANWYARDLKIRPGMMASMSGGLATMGCGVPYAIAAKFAHPDQPVIALVGDGAMQMNGNSELVTVAKYWKRWRNPTLIIGVLNNRDLNQVTWEQRALAGDPKFSARQDLPDFPYARYAELLGLKGCCADKPEAVAPAWEKALAADRPCVVDMYVDPNVPPLPPHISFKQARTYMSALWKGDPDTADVLRRSASDFIDALIPRR
ncbi:MAG: thiamine pyrophosphate-requiring protein [Thiohalomonadaceae bacterium]